MGMLQRLTSLLRGSRRGTPLAVGGDGSPASLALEMASLDARDRPVALDVSENPERCAGYAGPGRSERAEGGGAGDDPGFDDGYITFHSPAAHAGGRGVSAAAPAAGEGELDAIRSPKNKQELIVELQKNYAEVLHLVRKVDHHLDEQARRSARLLELAERMPETVAELATIREQHASLLERVERLSSETREGHARADEARQRQLAALGEVRSAMEVVSGTERRVADSLDEFRGTMTAVAGSTDKLNDALVVLREREDERDARLARVIVAGQKWVVTAVVLGLVCLGAVVVMGVVAMGR